VEAIRIELRGTWLVACPWRHPPRDDPAGRPALWCCRRHDRPDRVGRVRDPARLRAGRRSAAGATTLHYELARPTTVKVELLDYAKKRVRTLLAARAQAPGAYDIVWDGRGAPTGPYVQDGGFRFRLTISDANGTFFTERPVTKAPAAIFRWRRGS